MSEVHHPKEISDEERERVMSWAEGNRAFQMIAQALSDLMDQSGEPESEIELAIGQNRDLIVMFRLFRIAAQVNRRLSGKPRQQFRFLEAERAFLEVERALKGGKPLTAIGAMIMSQQ